MEGVLEVARDLGVPATTIILLMFTLYRIITHWVIPIWTKNQEAYIRFVESVRESNQGVVTSMDKHRSDMDAHMRRVGEDSVASLKEIRDLRSDLNKAFSKFNGGSK